MHSYLYSINHFDFIHIHLICKDTKIQSTFFLASHGIISKSNDGFFFLKLKVTIGHLLFLWYEILNYNGFGSSLF